MDKKIDEFMMEKINEIEVPFDLDIDKIIANSKKNSKRKKEKVITIAVCLILAIIVSFSIMYIYNKNDEENIDLNANLNSEEDKQLSEDYGIIYSNLMDTTSMYIIPDIKEVFENYKTNKDYVGTSGVVIARVEDIKYTNYDKDDESSNHYTFVRSIASIKVLKSIDGIFNEGDIIEVRAKGGVIDYNEYVKEFKQYNSSPDAIDSIVFEQEYKELTQEGKTKIYVSEYNKYDTKLESGKTYIMFVSQKIWGDYWIETGNTLLREYNKENNTILNNNTGKYENLDEVLENKK